jgi:hypothetical protein
MSGVLSPLKMAADNKVHRKVLYRIINTGFLDFVHRPEFYN